MENCHPSVLADGGDAALRVKIADSLFHNSSEGICVTDAANRIIEVNPTYCTLSGYRRDELLGETPKLLQSGLQNAAYYAAMWSELQQLGEWHGELWNRNKSGELFAVRLNISSIHDAAGQVTHFLAIMADITLAKAQQQAWENRANHDALTGLPNRSLLLDRLQQAMAQSLRTHLMLAICYLDLDGFKPINDQNGHQAGDLVLVETARRLHASVREGDTVARVGGDEFVLLLWGLSSVDECDHTLMRVLRETCLPIRVGDGMASVTVSVGVTVFPGDGDQPAQLTAQADSAMYRAKIAGGNRFVYFGR